MNILVTNAFKDYNKLKESFSSCNFFYIENEDLELMDDYSEVEYIICNNLFLNNNIEQFKSLRYIQTTSVGLDRLPLDKISKKNVEVFNAKNVYSVPMAEWTICKILDVYKKSFEFSKKQEHHIWERDRDIEDLFNKNVTIIGYGDVGREIGKRLFAFGCKITAVNRKKKEDEFLYKSFAIEELNESIINADIIICTLPLTVETEGILDNRVFNKIQKKPILINVSRGKVINMVDLLKKKNRFSKIILDVFEKEPLDKKNVLWDLDNVIITPHNSFVSNTNRQRLYSVVANNLEYVLKKVSK